MPYVSHHSKPILFRGPLLRATCFKAVSLLSAVRDRFFTLLSSLHPIFGGHVAFVKYSEHELLEK